MRVRAAIAYDGTDYSGFQRQANAPTVQAALEAALARVTQETITVMAAGRTDAGVHAAGQVIAFDTAWRHDLGDLRRALNAVLPADVAVLEVEEAAPGFHPRYDARSRCYRYTLYNAPVRSPLVRRYSLHVAASMDTVAMQQAAQFLVGEHDFATFGQPPQGEVTVRCVLAAEWGFVVNVPRPELGTKAQPNGGEPPFGCPFGSTQGKAQGGPWLTFDIEANAFLYRMVRSIVGTLLQVGRGAMSVEEFAVVLAACDRSQARPTASPHGLCLMEVRY